MVYACERQAEKRTVQGGKPDGLGSSCAESDVRDVTTDIQVWPSGQSRGQEMELLSLQQQVRVLGWERSDRR